MPIARVTCASSGVQLQVRGSKSADLVSIQGEPKHEADGADQDDPDGIVGGYFRSNGAAVQNLIDRTKGSGHVANLSTRRAHPSA